ncbi:hypothetical protein J437_LFUL010907 [Ladona fulva]|uniref:C2H2-type domain-containing protein n=1 Tax=Ladona fulva TaxID=123851 RepID=A0A8K0KCJ0_LADFU|nr:hypothetical protein J437_LFUL010907 [Ladona fulva]
MSASEEEAAPPGVAASDEESGDDALVVDEDAGQSEEVGGTATGAAGSSSGDEGGTGERWLPQCKIKRNYICHCNYFTQNPRLYLYHLRDVHGERIRVYECPNCLYASKHSQKLQRHIHMVHIVGRPKGNKGSAKRGAERRRSGAVGVSAAEEGEATGEGVVEVVGEGGFPTTTFRCSACSFSSRSRSLVMRHEHIAHVLKKRFFRCGKCSYATHVKARYTKHVKYHSMPMIKCERCDFRTPYKWNLDRHCKNHSSDPSATNQGAFRCPLCDFSADIKQSLTVHVQNHHLSPEQARAARRRNKVGASDSADAEAASLSTGAAIDSEEMELLRMEREENYFQGGTYDRMSSDNAQLLPANEDQNRVPSPASTKVKAPPKKMRGPSAAQEQNERHNFRTDFIHPDDIIQKNGNVYIKNLKCNYCNFKAVWEGEMLRHESKAHGIEHPKPMPKTASNSAGKRCSRPVPNLIPIQGKGVPPAIPAPIGSSSLPILRIPNLKCRSSGEEAPRSDVEVTMSDKDMNALINAETARNSALKDFASLIGDLPDSESTSRPTTPKNSATSTRGSLGETTPVIDTLAPETSTTSISPSTTPGKKAGASFFDRLKERLLVSAGDGLVCEICGHESKCLSEKARHQKLHDATPEGTNLEENNGEKKCRVGAGNALVGLSSTRCQHCRQRCKTSADLMVHLQSCLNSVKDDEGGGVAEEEETEGKEEEEIKGEEEGKEDEDGKGEDGKDEDDEEEEEPHPMENKVFVWNNCAQPGEGGEGGGQSTHPQNSSASDGEGLQSGEDAGGGYLDDGEGLVGVETAPGIGAITGRAEADLAASGHSSKVTLKKVFKCPQCSFWATTASRFHVHAVGHLNRKPFECSACGYRSNWRWDITKHIRLRAAWDEAHRSPPGGGEGAGPRVLMTDETGRRNYSKYNRHLTLVRVHEMIGGDSGASGEGSMSLSPQFPLEGHKAPKSMMVNLPAPPRLTPAPVQSTSVADDAESSPPPLLRPPPPLRAAAAASGNRVGQAREEGEEGKGVKRSAPQGSGEGESKPAKRTLWKCKKCNYRDASRELILAHVRQHYAAQQHPSSQPMPSQMNSHSSEKADKKLGGDGPLEVIGNENCMGMKTGDSKPYGCGHCGRISNWKHVIQRHCRLKHGGDILVIEQPAVDGDPSNNDMSDSAFKCDKCPFMAKGELELENHFSYHYPRPGAVFKCYFCAFYVFQKRDLLLHMRLHAPDDNLDRSKAPASLDGSDSADGDLKEKHDSPEGGKRYSCVGCPYVSNSKSQFLYHKQFHRPRGVAPFKCSFCSYSVSRRHLLHQHLRVHGVSIPSGMKDDDSKLDVTKRPRITARLPQQVLDTSRLTDVPLVWVSRAGKFHKMFKCRFCPHVNVRKINIQEHEKMHKQRRVSPSSMHQSGMGDGSPGSGPGSGAGPHKCPQCNYSCNNAGVLSAHAKVHLESYGKVHCLVDTNRADEEQIAELEAGSTSLCQEPMDSDSGGMSAEEDVSERVSEVAEVSDNNADASEGRVLHFCPICPARFVFERELVIHRRFHGIRLPFKCEACSYAARQRPHLLAHLKVHTREYQEKSATLAATHTVSVHHPKPHTAPMSSNDPLHPEPMWVVVPESQSPRTHQENVVEMPSPSVGTPPSVPQPNKHYACDRCPARFFKGVALQYHLTLHGGPGPYRCRTCDYAVKTYGNLVRHEMIHGTVETPTTTNTSAVHSTPTVIPLSGTELFRQREAAGRIENSLPSTPPSVTTSPAVPPSVDPQFGTLMHGNPDFIYPTYFKNGKLKEKRYKCHKCPSAFEKREQYKVHLSLHGSRQRYRCDKCDYAVKYCANYIQHVRKHTRCEEAQLARQQQFASANGAAPVSVSEASPAPVVTAATPPTTMQSSPSRPVKSITPAAAPALSTAEKQQALLQRLRQEAAGAQEREEEERRKRNVFLCMRCPYSTHRKDSLEAHTRRHPGATEASVAPGPFPCPYCDYAAPQSHFLREHIKLHFKPARTLPKPEAYVCIERMELWEGESKDVGKLVFKDSGVDGYQRFLPVLDINEGSDGEDMGDEEKTYIDPESGEIIQASELQCEDIQGNEDSNDVKEEGEKMDWSRLDAMEEESSELRDSDDANTRTLECMSGS